MFFMPTMAVLGRSVKQIVLLTFDHSFRINLDHVCTRTKSDFPHHRHKLLCNNLAISTSQPVAPKHILLSG